MIQWNFHQQNFIILHNKRETYKMQNQPTLTHNSHLPCEQQFVKYTCEWKYKSETFINRFGNNFPVKYILKSVLK